MFSSFKSARTMVLGSRSMLMASGLVLLMGACDAKGPRRVEITENREISRYVSKPIEGITPQQRFGLIRNDSSHATSHAQSEPASRAENPLQWETPQGWTELPSSGQRIIDLRFGQNQEGEFYLSALPGEGGGLGMNINRWRTQMGLPPMAEKDIAELTLKPFLRGNAVYVDFTGDYTNMGQSTALKDYRLVGLVQPVEGLTIFVKMTGPKTLVEQELPQFEKLIQSIQFRARN